jgi:hypothetical protein
VHPLIVRQRNWLDVGFEIVQDQIDVLHAHDQHQMMFAVAGDDLGQEERT